MPYGSSPKVVAGDEHRALGIHPAVQIFTGDFPLKDHDPVSPSYRLAVGYPRAKLSGRSAFLRIKDKGPQVIKPGLGKKPKQSIELLLSLPRETHDDGGPETDLRFPPAETFYKVKYFLGPVGPSHPPKDFRVGVLDREIQIRGQSRLGLKKFQEFRG